RVAPGARRADFPQDFAARTADGARAVVRLGIRLFGTDAPSIDPFASRTLEAHHILHAGGVAILEGLRLAEVEAGDYELIALPLRWQGVDAAPGRAVLRIEGEEASWKRPG